MKASDLRDSQQLLGDQIADFGNLALETVRQLSVELRETREELAASLMREHLAVEELNRLKAQR